MEKISDFKPTNKDRGNGEIEENPASICLTFLFENLKSELYLLKRRKYCSLASKTE